MSKHKIDLLEFYIASHVNMKKLNSKQNKEIEDQMHIEALRTKLKISLQQKTNRKNERANRK